KVSFMLEILSRRFFLKLNLSDHWSILTDLQGTLKGKWRYLIPAKPPIHNLVLIPNYQDFKIQDFRYSDGFECFQAIKIGRYEHKINAHEVTPFTHLESYRQRPVVNIKTKKAHDPYLDVRSYDTSNAQDNQGHEEHRDDPTLESSVCKIRRFKMMKYSFNADEEYISIKESEYLNHSKDNLDAYRELLRIIDEGWVVATPNKE
nr:hypothetical protein [Tanacetum cinerariifolium]